MRRSLRAIVGTAVISLMWIVPVAGVPGQQVEDDEVSVGDTVESAGYSRKFAAVGELRRNRPAPDGSARYALIDEQGTVSAYLTARPELYLFRYVGRRVGVTAKSLSYREGHPANIQVGAITPLDEQTVAVRPAVHLAEVGTAVLDELADTSERPERPVAFEEPIVEQPLLPFGGIAQPTPDPEAVYFGDVAGVGGCPTCGTGGCGHSGWFWVRGEYLLWWADGMPVPPLVTTSPAGTGRDDAGVLGQPGTAILFGNQDVLANARSGLRLRFGGWVDSDQLWGLEGEYFGLGDQTDLFQAASRNDGTPILARPFFNINPTNPVTGVADPPARQDSSLVAFPNTIIGGVSVAASASRFDSFETRLLLNLCCNNFGTGNPYGAGSNGGQFSRVDLLVGYRFLRLAEGLLVAENSTSLQPANPGSFAISDVFDTQNEFNGFELGSVWGTGWGRWSFEMLTKLGLGNVRQTVDILGQTTFSRSIGPSEVFQGGMLAQRTNIGRHRRDEFAMVPEIGATLGYEIREGLRATLGYTFLYWSRVVRPGDQIDLELNPDLFPPQADPFTGALRPRFAFSDTDFWLQGFNVGLDYQW